MTTSYSPKGLRHHVNKWKNLDYKKVKAVVEDISRNLWDSALSAGRKWMLISAIWAAAILTACSSDSAEVKLAKAQVEQAEDALEKAEDYASSVEEREEAEEDLRQAEEDLEDAQDMEEVDKKIMNGDLE